MWYLQKHVALSRELLFCDTASLCQLHEAYQVILPQIGKVLDLFEHVMVKKDQNREKCSCLIFFSSDISATNKTSLRLLKKSVMI